MSSQDTAQNLDTSFDSSTMRCTTQHIKRTFEDIENDENEKTVTKYLDRKCPICYENFDDENNVAITNCGHHACITCMNDCLEQSRECFKCRQPLLTISTIEWGIIDLDTFLENILKESTIFDFNDTPQRQVTCGGYQSHGLTRQYTQSTQSNYYQSNSHMDNYRQTNHNIVLPSVPITTTTQNLQNDESSDELICYHTKKTILNDTELSTLVLIAPFVEIVNDGVNIYFIIDVSGSMSSQNRIKFCKDALIETTKKLKSNQRMTIITFDDYSVQEIALGPINSLNIDEINSKIIEIAATGGTNYNIAFEHLIQILCEGSNIVFFMTDGEPSQNTDLSILERLYSDYPILIMYIISMGSDVDATKNLLPLLFNRSDQLGIYMHFHNFDSFVPFINDIVGSSTSTFATNIILKFEGCIPISSKCIYEENFVLLKCGALQFNNTLQFAYTIDVDKDQIITICYDIDGTSYEVISKLDEDDILGIELNTHFPNKRFMDRKVNEIRLSSSLSKKEKKELLETILLIIKEEDLGLFYEEFTKCLRLLIDDISALSSRRTYNADNSFLQSQTTTVSRNVSANISLRSASQTQRVHFEETDEQEINNQET